MILKILLIISILLQLAAALIAMRLVSVTKYNASWIFLTVALTFMSLLRMGEYTQLFLGKDLRIPSDVFAWIGVVTSLCFACGVFLIQKILNHLDKIERQRRLSEERILNTVIKTEERERLRFSKDIHDGLGPLLSSAKMLLSAVDTSTFDPQQREIVGNTSTVIDEAIKTMREVSNNLSPHVLQNFGLERALNNFINRLDNRSEITIDFRSTLNRRRLDSNAEVILYRIVCEMINNTIKHAGATSVEIALDYSPEQLSLTYTDDGRGFFVEQVLANAEAGMGLSNMVSRVESLKGQINVASSPGRGVKIEIIIPELR